MSRTRVTCPVASHSYQPPPQPNVECAYGSRLSAHSVCHPSAVRLVEPTEINRLRREVEPTVHRHAIAGKLLPC